MVLLNGYMSIKVTDSCSSNIRLQKRFGRVDEVIPIASKWQIYVPFAMVEVIVLWPMGKVPGVKLLPRFLVYTKEITEHLSFRKNALARLK